MTLMAALAMLGALVLAAVVAHGAWMARKASPKRADERIDATRREPVMAESPQGDEAVDEPATAVGQLDAGLEGAVTLAGLGKFPLIADAVQALDQERFGASAA